MMAPRVYVAMSDDGLFPSALAAVRPGTGTPARAMLLLATLASGFVLVGTFQQIVAFFICTALTFIALAAAALFVIRGRLPDTTPSKSPGYPLTPALFVLLVLLVVVTRADGAAVRGTRRRRRRAPRIAGPPSAVEDIRS